MTIKRISRFKDPVKDTAWFENWVRKLESLNNRTYEKFELTTSLGKTIVWGVNTDKNYSESLVIFPGFRTTPLIWDFDRSLDHLGEVKIYLVETNGQPNLSDGNTPAIKSLDYGHWMNEVFEKLNLEKAFIAGASFGGLICMKMAITHPEKIKAAFLLNPGCMQTISFDPVDFYYLLLPVIKPTEKNIIKFLNKSIYCKPHHQLSPEAEKMLIDYEFFALTRYIDKTQKPYFMKRELLNAKAPVYLLEGTCDPLFPYKRSVANAKKYISALKEVKIFENVGHGIEGYAPAMKYMGEMMADKLSGN